MQRFEWQHLHQTKKPTGLYRPFRCAFSVEIKGKKLNSDLMMAADSTDSYLWENIYNTSL